MGTGASLGEWAGEERTVALIEQVDQRHFCCKPDGGILQAHRLGVQRTRRGEFLEFDAGPQFALRGEARNQAAFSNADSTIFFEVPAIT